MRRTLAVTAIIAAGLTALGLAASPALAANGPGNGPGTGPHATTGCPMWNADGTTGQTYGGRYGQGGMMGNGQGRGPGSGMMGQNLTTVPSGTLTSTQKEALVGMADEEKMAHDVYVTLGTRYPELWQFARIQRSESMHQAAIRNLLTRYDVTDPTAGLAVGTFATDRIQGLYDGLVNGATSSAAALDAGVTVEETDIADLTKALDGLSAQDVTFVYTNLRNASEDHLAAFGG
jgi:hypothetical protein